MDMENETFVNVETLYRKMQILRTKSGFFKKCKTYDVLPLGLSLKFNLALGINDYSLVDKIQTALDRASSSIVDSIQDFCLGNIAWLEEELGVRKTEAKNVVGAAPFARGFVGIKRRVGFEANVETVKLNKKLKKLKGKQIIGPANFLLSRGSRRIRALVYRKEKVCACPADLTVPQPVPYVRRLRPHHRDRASYVEKQQNVAGQLWDTGQPS